MKKRDICINFFNTYDKSKINIDKMSIFYYIFN